MEFHYSAVRNAQIVLYLLKAYGIKKVVASPGTQNMSLVASMQQDSFFEMYSAADERSAAYMACGLAAESGEPVVLSCTGATASRNYVSGLTEAYYRHLPVVAITSTEKTTRVGHNVAQVIDRSVIQNDIAKCSVLARAVNNDDDAWDCMIQVNKALLEINHHGVGPVHINLEKVDDIDFSVLELPKTRVIRRITSKDTFPDLPCGRIGIFVGSHLPWSKEQTDALDGFCEANDAVVFCDHTSNYKGKYRVLFSLVASQDWCSSPLLNVYLLVHIGQVSGDYFQQGKLGANAKEVWRIDEDGKIKDTFKKLTCVFEMTEQEFFEHYSQDKVTPKSEYFDQCQAEYDKIFKKIPELPFGNIWIAKQLASSIPENCAIHFGVLNSLRSWNFFELPQTVISSCNVGGFGIDGGVSTLIGSSLAHKDKLHFGVFGDLAFFYDMNVLGNRHVGKNVRILLVNNAVGSEFKLYIHPASRLGEDANKFIAAGGHYGNKSPLLVKHYAEDLGFEYITASNKEEFKSVYKKFVSPEMGYKPIIFEVFTDENNESDSLKTINGIEISAENKRKGAIKKIIGEKAAQNISKIIHKL
jgi:2-succinyl-5-enolpyruvyl-6-hydroxy-3-cyclohexene-1-carboxylate synthase